VIILEIIKNIISKKICNGAHFEILKLGRGLLLKYNIIRMMFNNKFDFANLVKIIWNTKGLKFIFNRRGQIIELLITKSITANYERRIYFDL
tara:strand:- start:1292 stop:1567 length:276 start_codon:yes stop_codon:yes gene_type:complete